MYLILTPSSKGNRGIECYCSFDQLIYLLNVFLPMNCYYNIRQIPNWAILLISLSCNWYACNLQQESGQMSQLRSLTKYNVQKMAKSHCYCPILLMRTTKTAVCLQTKAIFHHLYGF